MKRNNLRVLLAFDLEGPKTSDENYEHYMETEESWFTEGHVLQTLRENGHEVHLGPIHRDPRELVDLVEKIKPDVIWNSVEAIEGKRYYETHVIAVLEMLGVPYTGCGMAGSMLCKDKALSKRILAHHRVHVPWFVVSHRGQPIRKLDRTRFPVFVKPLAGEGSEGISRDSFAEEEKPALKRVRFLHQRMKADVIVEHYIAGRELYVAVLGNDRLKVLPPRELVFTKVPKGEPTYASYKAKWDRRYRSRWGIDCKFPKNLTEAESRDIVRVAKRVYRALQMRGYGRIDMRLSNDGKLYVVEANPNPEIADYEDFSESARKAGLEYNDLIERILRLALEVRLP